NLGAISTSRELSLSRRERATMIALTVILIAIEATITVVKPHARSFALIVLVVGLAARLATIVSNRAVPMAKDTRIRSLAAAVAAVVVEIAAALLLPEGWASFGVSVGIALVIGYLSNQVHSARTLVAAGVPGALPAPGLEAGLAPGAAAAV